MGGNAQSQRNQMQPDQNGLKRQLARAEKEIANIMAAIKAGIITASTKIELEKAEKEKAAAMKALKADAPAPVEPLPDMLPRAVERYKGLMRDLEKVLPRDVIAARQCIQKLVGPIKLMPEKEGYLIAELSRNHEALIELTYCNSRYIPVVAGAGFEPAAFRL